MKDVWDRMETWLGQQAPECLQALQPPATREQIAEAEKILGMVLPDEVRATFLIHNGQRSDAPWLLDGWEFLSLERLVDEWSVWKDLLDGGDFADCHSESTGETVTDWWHPGWIPLTYSGAGDHHCLDLHPGPEGQAGQIIQMWHDESSRPVMASSYRAWMLSLVEAWEAGAYELSEDFGGIVARE